ncbi:hypothetical protein C358_03366, partial [Cryptococcus neoformans MW-RSA852]
MAARMRLFRVASQSTRTYDWHRICQRATEIMPNVTQVNDWQWKAAKGITEGRSQIILSATGSGKIMVWILLLLAMK